MMSPDIQARCSMPDKPDGSATMLQFAPTVGITDGSTEQPGCWGNGDALEVTSLAPAYFAPLFVQTMLATPA